MNNFPNHDEFLHLWKVSLWAKSMSEDECFGDNFEILVTNSPFGSADVSKSHPLTFVSKYYHMIIMGTIKYWKTGRKKNRVTFYDLVKELQSSKNGL